MSDNKYLQEEDNVDILNLNTYDDFDWIILVLCLFIFACLFTCYGWCLHKICIYNKVAGNQDADVETLSTKLSMTQRGKAADFFRGLSIRAGLKLSNLNTRTNSTKRSSNVVKWQSNLTSINECKHTKRGPKSTTLNLPPQPNMGTIPPGDEVEMNRFHKMKKTDSESILKVLDTTFVTPSKRKTGLKKRSSLQSPQVPTPGLTPGLPSPGSNMKSATHISMNIPYEYSENPYKIAAKTQKLVSIAEHNGNNDGLVILDHEIDEDAIDATTPLTTPL